MQEKIEIPRMCKKREVNGILLLDKPLYWTSNQAVQNIKRLYGAKKVGHTGSLDPLATGVLPICLGEATKISNFLLNADKKYKVTCTLGARTASFDAETPEIETFSIPDFNKADWLKILNTFQGEIEQVPPMHSAIKQNGKPLYLLAHQGQSVERNARKITIYSIDYIEHSQTSLTLEVHCSKGTYIRTLIDDIGLKAGCGAYVTALHRVQVGDLPQQTHDWQTLVLCENCDCLDKKLLPVDIALQDRTALFVSQELAFYLKQGQAVIVPNAPVAGEVRLYQRTPALFLGLGVISEDGKVAPKRMFNL